MGTPKDDVWPGVEQLPDYKSTFPNWSKKDLKGAINGLDDVSADLLAVSSAATHSWSWQRMLVYDPAKRISAKASLQHEYFRGQAPKQ
jgi:cyclin-dependent kinase